MLLCRTERRKALRQEVTEREDMTLHDLNRFSTEKEEIDRSNGKKKLSAMQSQLLHSFGFFLSFCDMTRKRGEAAEGFPELGGAREKNFSLFLKCTGTLTCTVLLYVHSTLHSTYHIQ